MTWHKVCEASNLLDGDATKIIIAGESIAVYNVNGFFFATQDRCTHAEASLAEGFVDGDCIECPLHQGVFHIPTGECRSGPVTRDLQVYTCKLEDGKVYVLIGEATERVGL